MEPLIVVLSKNSEDWVRVVCKAENLQAAPTFSAWNFKDGKPQQIGTLNDHAQVDIVFAPIVESIDSLLQQARGVGRKILVAYHRRDHPNLLPRDWWIQTPYSHENERCWKLLENIVTAIKGGKDGKIPLKLLCSELSRVHERLRQSILKLLIIAWQTSVRNVESPRIEERFHKQIDRFGDILSIDEATRTKLKTSASAVANAKEMKDNAEAHFVEALRTLRDELFKLLDTLKSNEAARAAPHA